MDWLRLLFGGLAIIVNITSLVRLHNGGLIIYSEDACLRYRDDGFDVKAMNERIEEVLEMMETLQLKLEYDILKMVKDGDSSDISRLKFRKYLQEAVVQPFYGARVALKQVKLPKVDGIRNFEFDGEEIRKYVTPKENKNKDLNIFRTRRTHNTIGHSCVLVKEELEEYMNYEVGSYCKDDWKLAQKLMLQGCDPLPRRRCLTRASNESLWNVPSVRMVSRLSNFLIDDVLGIKPGGIRIGLDFSLGTGIFASMMMEQNVTIISSALNLHLGSNEMIARRGLIPLYLTLNQRLPLFENTMDLIHTTGILDGWIDMSLLDYVLHDWDRVLRPGGLLWIDKFMCNRQDLDDYMYMFLQFKYKKHKWVVASKSKDEVYLSALLEKTRRSV